MRRASWDQTFAAVARAMAARSECARGGVGAVVVDRSHRIISTGYNGKPERLDALDLGETTSCVTWCPRATGGPKESCPSIHAEANALLWGSRREREGGTIYITRAPCMACAKLIANSGLYHAAWLDDPEDRDGRTLPVVEFLSRAFVTVHVMEGA